MIAGNGEHGRGLAQPANKAGQLAKLGRAVHHVAAEQHDIRPGLGRRVHDLPAERFAPATRSIPSRPGSMNCLQIRFAPSPRTPVTAQPAVGM